MFKIDATFYNSLDLCGWEREEEGGRSRGAKREEGGGAELRGRKDKRGEVVGPRSLKPDKTGLKRRRYYHRGKNIE